MIFAAGLGTRLKPITDTIPKALLPLGGKTLLQYQIEKLRAAGITDIVINVHHFPEQIIAYLKEHNHFDCRISISDESQYLLETGGGLRKAAEYLLDGTDEPVLACNVDVLSNINLKAVIAAHQDEALATLVVSDRDTQRYLLFDNDLRMKGWTNLKTKEVRPAGINPDHLQRLAFSGMHILSARMLHDLQSWPEKFSIIDYYVASCSTQNIRAYVPNNYRMMDVGKIDHLQEAEAFAKTL